MTGDVRTPGGESSPHPHPEEELKGFARLKRWLIGQPRDLGDRSLFHDLSLVPILAWIGLGADGLSSSCYGPEEAFKTLGDHTYLAIGLAVVMAVTVLIISLAYSKIIELFPHGGGGYVVATKLLGEKAGVVSGSALLVDYVLTITISIAAAGDALFSFLPLGWHGLKLPVEVFFILGMMLLNFRGVRESVLILSPIFFIFLITHAILIFGGFALHIPELPATINQAASGFDAGLSTLGLGGLFLLFIHAYSLGGGTYTGIEAVSNGMAIMREPRVRTGKRTMAYMAISLAITASGLLFCYLLWDVHHEQGKTMNAVFAEKFVAGMPFGTVFVIIVLLSEGALLVVAAQAGFVDGPRVLANMANDSWMPRRFAALSERLTTQNGILLMGLTALAALLYTSGDVRQIVVMYSINVFITFSMTLTAMCRHFWSERKTQRDWIRKIWIHAVGLVMCLTILVVTVYEKFRVGGWMTLLVTGGFVGLCLLVRKHYRQIQGRMAVLDQDMIKIDDLADADAPVIPAPDPNQPTAVILVGGYGGVGLHTLLHAHRAFPGQFKNIVFMSVGVIDSGAFKGQDAIDALTANTLTNLLSYVGTAQKLGFAATQRMAIGTDVVQEAEKLCVEISQEFPKCVFFAGQITFQNDAWYHGLLHNQTAFSIQRRLQWRDLTMVILPVRIYE